VELHKSGERALEGWIHEIMTEVWNSEVSPEEWNKGIIVPIYKKGSQLRCENFRGITLLNIGYKIFFNILYERLKPFVEIYLFTIRKAFEQVNEQLIKYSPYDRFLKKTSEYGVDAYHIFVDFKAAYDSVLRNKLYEAMLHLGIPGKLIRLTKMTMITVQCSVKIQNISEQFETNNGLRQGDALACLLFNVVLEKVMRDAGILNSGTIYNKSTQVLAYADGINIIVRYLCDTIEVFTKLERSAKKFGLQVNESKTNIWCYRQAKHAEIE
jgi:sorting nexin-29